MYLPGEQLEVTPSEVMRLVALRAAVIPTNILEDENNQEEQIEEDRAPKPEETLDNLDPDDEMEKRIAMEEEYRALGGRPQPEWPIEKLQAKLEERRAE